MIKDQEHLKSKASYCLDLAKKLGATDASVTVGNSISESVSFRNRVLDESNRSDSLAISIETYIGKKRSSISSSNLLDENLSIPELREQVKNLVYEKEYLTACSYCKGRTYYSEKIKAATQTKKPLEFKEFSSDLPKN